MRLKTESKWMKWCLAASIAIAMLAGSGCGHVARVQSDPPGAVVKKDGRTIGVTPVEVPIEIGPINGSQTSTVEKNGASRTVQFANDEFMWVNLLLGLGAGVAGSMSMGLLGASFVSTSPLLGNTLLWISPAFLVITPISYFFFLCWRMPESVTIGLNNKDVFTSPTGNFTMISAEGNASTMTRKKRRKRKKRKKVRVESYDEREERRPLDDDEEPSRRMLSPDDDAPAGAAGQACYEDRTCNGELNCVDGACREAAADGAAGGACYGNNTCNDGLTCTDGTCRSAPTGSLGGACYGNHTCNDDMVCDAGTCIAAEE